MATVTPVKASDIMAGIQAAIGVIQAKHDEYMKAMKSDDTKVALAAASKATGCTGDISNLERVAKRLKSGYYA